LTEARNALHCAAENRDSALNTFEEVTDRFIQHVRNDKTLKAGLKEWAKEVSKIPLDRSVLKIPKILIIGGLNLQFCHYPVEEYFLEQGIIPKVVDPSETIQTLLAERAIRHGFKRGLMKPQQQLNLKNILLSFLSRNFKNTKDALISMSRVNAYHRKSHQYRKIIGKSGLLFDESPSYASLLTNSYEFVSHNGFTEASTITGRFLNSRKSRVYDGIINLGCFNCSPAMNSQAIIRPIANKTNIAYSAVDVEGPFISTNQRRLLETIAIQAKRIRENKELGESSFSKHQQ
jgi:hypothetical protein